jgi:phosphoribosylformylglycinamidine synthase
VVGRITDDSRWRATYRGKVVADIPVKALSDEAPIYDRPAKAPTAFIEKPATNTSALAHAHVPSPMEALRALLSSPNVGSKRWVFRQYDSIVQSNTVGGPGSDAAVLRIKGSRRALALKVDSNPRACALDPYLGAVATVCEAARNVACAGARPAGITNCLNYGNPERPEIMWQFIRGVEGLRDAALAFDTPVISGNVSFYNETEGRAIPPTPTIAIVGVMADVSHHLKQHFKFVDDLIVMVRTGSPALAASEYAALFGADDRTLSPIDLERERRLVEGLVVCAERGLIRSAHDVSEGGLAVALAEACFNPDGLLGAEVSLERDSDAGPGNLFGEGPSTVIVSASAENIEVLHEIFSSLECRVIGRVAMRPRLRIAAPIGQIGIDEDVADLRRLYEDALPGRLR